MRRMRRERYRRMPGIPLSEDSGAASGETGGPGGRPDRAGQPGLFVFNDRLYFWLLKPVARGYAFLVPESVRIGIRNALTNVVDAGPTGEQPPAGKGEGRRPGTGAFHDQFDHRDGRPLRHGEERLGNRRHRRKTRGRRSGIYGLGHGAYLVLPFLGPSSLRDAAGLGGDVFLNPLWYLVDFQTGVAIRAGKAVNDTSLRIGEYEDIKAAAIDPYLAVRDGYVQYREGQVAQ